jgi:hypothetical protein
MQFLMKFLTCDRLIFRAMKLFALAPVKCWYTLGKKFNQVATERKVRILDGEINFYFIFQVI